MFLNETAQMIVLWIKKFISHNSLFCLFYKINNQYVSCWKLGPSWVQDESASCSGAGAVRAAKKKIKKKSTTVTHITHQSEKYQDEY